MRATAPVLLLTLLLSACYSYAAPRSEDLRHGARIRAHLSPPRDIRLTNITANDVVVVDGELIRSAADTTVLSAWLLHARSGFDFVGAGETVRLPSSQIAAVEERRFSYLKSAGLLGAAVLGMFVVSSVVDFGGGGDEPPPNGGPPQ